MSEVESFTRQDVVYLSRPTGDLLARLYKPLTPGRQLGPMPAIVDVHGGRWCAESRLTNAALDERLAGAGIFVMALDFRMPPQARYPHPVADVNFAIRWLKSRCEAFGVKRDWIGGLGTSSGGHQLLLNALAPNGPEFSRDPERMEGEPDASLAYAVACWPVTDPLARYRYAVERNMTVHVDSHHAYWPDEAAMAAGNPQMMVERGEFEALPSVLLVQGTNDVILPGDSAERFAAVYTAAGGSLVLEKFLGEGHTFITKDPSSAASQRAIETILNFIHAHTDGETA